jgi:chromosomal replication initiation ATPase DnaA
VVDDRIIHWLVARMERSLAAARTIVDRLDQLALARGSKITRALAAEALAQMDAGTDDTKCHSSFVLVL